ncbi:MAG: serine protease [Bacteroidetes bacterium HGW-Bacteroidetes-6]|nr:MAG: serine protease [Bacteroidetes bacterium HGW-Bacteroidetes-6]
MCFVPVKADEGMWLPIFIDRLNYTDMQKMGLNLTAEEIYSVNHSSLKDAIVIFGAGCTGEVVSSEGLVFTNHHCGYASIASLSTVSNDILTNGFYAQTMSDELHPKSGLNVRFLVRIENVTKRVLDSIPFEVTEMEREEIVNRVSKQIENEAVSEQFQEASVKGFFYGNEYYLFVYEVYPDVRLVMTPPLCVGNFGGDTDNWMWPRHTGDFSVFRIYTGPDGKPAEYNKNNIPMKPRYSLPVSIKPKEENDFAMILGYPGRTSRYITSDEVESNYLYINPSIVKIRDIKLKIMKKNMDASDEVRLMYASQYAQTANYWKYYIGQNKGIQRLSVIERKRIMEDDFDSWANNDQIPKFGYYRDALVKTHNSMMKLSRLRKVQYYISESFFRGSNAISFAGKFRTLFKELSAEKPNVSKIDDIAKGLQSQSEKYFELYDNKTEMQLFAAMIELYANDISTDFHPAFYKEVSEKFKNDYRLYADYAFLLSIFTNKDKMDAFLTNPTLEVMQKDPIFEVAAQVYDLYNKLLGDIQPLTFQLNQGMRGYVQGLREMYPDKKFYPDANSTMRLTYGKVLPYNGADAINYKYFSTLSGVMEKENPDNPEFLVPAKIKELYEKKDFGQYSENGDIVTCFLTNNDITGGNSGSPVINGNGELIGLAFDANWEAMSGDIVFEPELQRCICVDIRYVLFVIDKFAGGHRLIEELDIRK